MGGIGTAQTICSKAPMERIAIDILGPLPKTVSGNEYIMVISDYFTKWIECYALPDQQAYTVADTLVTKFFTRFGVPYFLHTDQGKNFESQLFQHVCDLLGIQKTRTFRYRPQSETWLNVSIEQFSKCWHHMLMKVGMIGTTICRTYAWLTGPPSTNPQNFPK